MYLLFAHEWGKPEERRHQTKKLLLLRIFVRTHAIGVEIFGALTSVASVVLYERIKNLLFSPYMQYNTYIVVAFRPFGLLKL